MARPQLNTVNYFPFYCEEGSKMFYLEETYGNDGFACFVKILRELAKTENHYLDLSKNTTLMFLSAKCKVPKLTLESIIKDLVELGKFDKVLWEENSIIWCQDFIDSIQDAYVKRKSKCITYPDLLLLLVSFGVRKPSKLPTKGVDNPQSKEEEIKVKKNIEDRKHAFGLSLEQFKEEYPRKLIADFFDYWTEGNASKNKMRFELEKTWETPKRLSTWASRDKDFKKEKQPSNQSITSKMKLTAEQLRNL